LSWPNSSSLCHQAQQSVNVDLQARTLMNQDTLTTLMRVQCSDLNMVNFSSSAAIQHWMCGAKTETRCIDLFKSKSSSEVIP